MFHVVFKYRRVLISTVVIAFFVGMIVMAEHEAYRNSYGVLLIVFILYNFIIHFSKKSFLYKELPFYITYEIYITSFLLLITMAIAITESVDFDNNNGVVYGVLWMGIILYNLGAFIEDKKQKFTAFFLESPQIHKDSILFKYRVRIFVIGAPMLVAGFVLSKNWKPANGLEDVFGGLLFLVLPGYIILSWIFEKWLLIKKLKNENTHAELTMLKNQVNPHFFFNTLNNLYGLTVEKSDQAPEVVLKISDMMRYSIYEGQKDTVLLVDELEYLKNYIELHKIRHYEELDIRFDHKIEDENYRVTPLLYIILLENAFKHGIENLTENLYIHINLIAEDNRILFSIENSFDSSQICETTGIGLKNLKRRLELIYPDKHQLLVVNNDNIFRVQLDLNIL
ncbi:sensor histidine kinase [Aquimarina sp. 2201CG14-23]|uniref:sensor histidine kinase n=1 Tax=Aquimarina mycalae TaxID=3040073 RepID=UPI002477E63E|nr:histidine kinase [Aquimarina sp. 2201CG14-23]MDH7446121.1 histidine kinase [Aquimarina sp. 2201CG14-23]